MKTVLVIAAAVGAYLLLTRKASAAKLAGFGDPAFVLPGTPSAPVDVIGCSFVRAGGQLLDANTGQVITEAEAAARARREGCEVPPNPFARKGK